jgi:hypothetical protein
MGVNTSNNIVILGGGIFGITASLVLSELGYNITVIEEKNDILLGATLVNQNRIHYGYHYPRSSNTIKESLIGLESFLNFYGNSVNYNFKKYYAISKNNSHITSDDFINICTSFNLKLEEKYPDKSLLNHDIIESCWLTDEPVFDYLELKKNIYEKLSKRKNIRIIRNCTVSKISDSVAHLSNGYKIAYKYLINSTYSNISDVLNNLGYKPLKSKYQLCVLPILELNHNIQPFGITIMDGPFCSLMPKGFEKNKYILYHVKESVIQEHIGYEKPIWLPIKNLVEFSIMENSKKYFPIINDMSLIDSWITTRLILPEHEFDDARPTFIEQNDDNVFTIFSGKLTTCVESSKELIKFIKH